MIESDLIEAIQVHQFQPGDRVIIRCKCALSLDAAARIKEEFQEFAPGVPVVILDNAFSIEILRGL